MTFDEFFNQYKRDIFNKQYFAEYTDTTKDRTFTDWIEAYADFLSDDFACPPSTQTPYGDYPFCVTEDGVITEDINAYDIIRRFKKIEDARSFQDSMKTESKGEVTNSIPLKVAKSIALTLINFDWDTLVAFERMQGRLIDLKEKEAVNLVKNEALEEMLNLTQRPETVYLLESKHNLHYEYDKNIGFKLSYCPMVADYR